MRVFVSYRRRDSGGHLPALKQILEESAIHGEACELFIDLDIIHPGRDFVNAIVAALKTSDVALALMGRHWLTEDGRRRLDEVDDPVRMELRTAIEMKTALLAVLLDRGAMPPPSELPPDIRDITRAKVIRLRDEAFDRDAAALVSAIGGFERRAPRGPAHATLRLVNEGTGWLGSGDQYNVRVDGRDVGLLLTGSGPTEFVLPPGRHSVRLQRGLRWSGTVAVTLRPGQAVSLAYEVRLLKIVLRDKTGGRGS
jgi:hypothetical protein